MYFAGKLVYLIVLPSNQLAINTHYDLRSTSRSMLNTHYDLRSTSRSMLNTHYDLRSTSRSMLNTHYDLKYRLVHLAAIYHGLKRQCKRINHGTQEFILYWLNIQNHLKWITVCRKGLDWLVFLKLLYESILLRNLMSIWSQNITTFSDYSHRDISGKCTWLAIAHQIYRTWTGDMGPKLGPEHCPGSGLRGAKHFKGHFFPFSKSWHCLFCIKVRYSF